MRVLPRDGATFRFYVVRLVLGLGVVLGVVSVIAAADWGTNVPGYALGAVAAVASVPWIAGSRTPRARWMASVLASGGAGWLAWTALLDVSATVGPDDPSFGRIESLLVQHLVGAFLAACAAVLILVLTVTVAHLAPRRLRVLLVIATLATWMAGAALASAATLRSTKRPTPARFLANAHIVERMDACAPTDDVVWRYTRWPALAPRLAPPLEWTATSWVGLVFAGTLVVRRAHSRRAVVARLTWREIPRAGGTMLVAPEVLDSATYRDGVDPHDPRLHEPGSRAALAERIALEDCAAMALGLTSLILALTPLFVASLRGFVF